MAGHDPPFYLSTWRAVLLGRRRASGHLRCSNVAERDCVDVGFQTVRSLVNCVGEALRLDGRTNVLRSAGLDSWDRGVKPLLQVPTSTPSNAAVARKHDPPFSWTMEAAEHQAIQDVATSLCRRWISGHSICSNVAVSTLDFRPFICSHVAVSTLDFRVSKGSRPSVSRRNPGEGGSLWANPAVKAPTSTQRRCYIQYTS